jgi:uncharacterized membrane protein YqaE (UPF0057 family)
MRYFLCLIPPVAVVLSSKNPLVWILNLILTLCLYLPGLFHAILVVNARNADRRTDRIVRAVGQR